MLQDKIVPHLSPKFVFRAAISALIGTVLGILISLVVNVSLVELTLSDFFGVYSGLLLISASLLIMFRLHSIQSGYPEEDYKNYIFAFSVIVFCSGFFCIFCHSKWFLLLPKFLRVSAYSFLGTSISFTLIFTIVDLLNAFSTFLFHSSSKSIVQSQAQVYLVVITAIIMGSIFGAIFGFLEVKDANSRQIQIALLREEHYCYPIGGLLGAIAGFGNEYIRLKNQCVWSALSTKEYDGDI